MFTSTSSPIIVFVDRNRLQFYGGKLSAIVAMDMPTTVVADLEVVNRDALYTLVGEWTKQNALGGNQLVFVLSPATYFEKTISAVSDTEQETEILKFYDMVPFEELLTKVMTGSSTTPKRAFATNSEYIEAIRHAFLLQGLRVVAVVPAFLLGTLASKRWMDAEMGAYAVKHIDELRAESVISNDDGQTSLPAPTPSVPSSANNPRLMILVSIFGVLLLALIVFFFVRH